MSNANCDVKGLYEDGEDEFTQALMEELWERRTDMTEMKAKIKLLRKERDEARRLHCRMAAQFIYLSGELCTAKFVADEKGWDCFKSEETQ
jgi:hypothetical protein